MDVFGSFALLLAFVCALYALVGGIAAILTRHPLLIKSARQAGIAACCLIFLATFSVVYLFVTDNFSMASVVSHSNRDLATSAFGLHFFGARHLSQQAWRIDAVCRDDSCGRAAFLFDHQ